MHDLFATDLCVFVIYPAGASGKMLANCLAMHDRFTLQHVKTILHDTPEKRFEDLMWRLEIAKSKDAWDDLGLGDYQLYGTPDWFDDDPIDVESYKENLLKNKLHANILKKMISDDLYFFRVVHNLIYYDFYKQVWPNSKKIFFKNANEWIKIRSRGRFSWPERPPIDNNKLLGQYHEFDCCAFINKQEFMKEYVNLVEAFELEPMNLDMVAEVYTAYMDVYFKAST